MGLQRSTLDDLRIDRSNETARPSRLWLWVLLLLLLIGAGSALGIWSYLKNKPPAVRTFLIQETFGNAPKTLLNASGYVVARRAATVSSKVTGKVIEVFVEEGVRVEQGQILARLDSSNVQTSLDLAEAQLTSAKGLIEETKVRLREAEAEYRRVTGLATNRVSSQAELDHATAEFHSLKARLAQQGKEVLVAERQVAVWKQQLDDTLIRAPFSGIVVSKNAQPGEMISPISAGGGFTRTGICTIVDMESLEVEIDVNESYINRVQSGQSVEATLDAYPDWKIPCRVKAIIPTADRQKATVKVRVGFVQLDPRILPEMGVKVAFQSAASSAAAGPALTLPKSAVLQQEGRDIVFLLQDGHARRRAVKVSPASGEEVALSAGLAAGDKVIISTPRPLQDGDVVQEAAP